jgi:hypothetical protein
MATAAALLAEAAGGKPISFRELMCGDAWERFQAGDQAGYARALAEQVEGHARPGDVVVLAQASMAPAAALIRRTDVEVLTSPDVGVRAALALLAAGEAR